MKKQILSAATIAIVSMSLITGCKKDDADTTNPTVTPNGGTITYVEKGKQYQEPGASANDDVDGTLTATPQGTVNTAVLGSYIITYTATDAAGNKGSGTRTVNVVEFDGSYTNSEVCDQSGSATGTSTVTASSSSLNNGMTIANFALATVTAQATYSGATVTIPSQVFGTDTYSGSGTISGGVGTALKMTINYKTVTSSGATNNCSATYTHL